MTTNVDVNMSKRENLLSAIKNTDLFSQYEK